MNPEIKKVVSETRELLNLLCTWLQESFGGEEVIDELMARRRYTRPEMKALLLEKGIFKMPTLHEVQLLAISHGVKLDAEKLRYLGLVSDQGAYFLEDRYAIPLRDWAGKAIAIVCWYPDARKYITTSTYGFTATATFFNMPSYKKAIQPDGTTCLFLVEGIFDALSIESLGYCALGNQGLDLSPIKKEMLKRFDRVIFIPDNDRPGRMSNPYLTLRSNHHWAVPNSRMVYLQGRCKDMDDFIKQYPIEDLEFLRPKDETRMVKLIT